MNNFYQTIKNNAEYTEAALLKKLALIESDRGYSEYSVLVDSMKYSLMAGGKRLRPCLVFEFGKLFGANRELCESYACSIEMIHTFSLIHDDMPCMDDDVMRRGKPTNHVIYGDACALLAGDSLIAYAFETLESPLLSDRQNLTAMSVLASSTGPRGMCGGQQIDLGNEGVKISPDTLSLLHDRKTGALIRCACALGCIAAGKLQDSVEYSAAMTYASAIGLAFQIADDILDVTGDESKLGKKCGSDEKDQKNTYVTLFGIDKARDLAKEQIQIAKKAISQFDGCEFLCELADYIITREN